MVMRYQVRSNRSSDDFTTWYRNGNPLSYRWRWLAKREALKLSCNCLGVTFSVFDTESEFTVYMVRQ